MTRILIADDHPIVLEGLAALFRDTAYDVVARCRSGAEVLAALEREAVEILVIDVNMPPPGGLEILAMMKREAQPAKVVLLTSSLSDGQILEAVRLGADGIVLKESAPQQLASCLQSVGAGERWFDAEVARRAVGEAVSHKARDEATRLLSPRELEIVRLVSRGLRNKEIARELRITEGTVKVYLHTIYEKLEVTSRVELSNLARDRNMLSG